MGPLVVFPDIELWATGYLSAALAARDEAYAQGVHVGTKVPNPRPDRAVIVNRDGGRPISTLFEEPRLRVRVWGAPGTRDSDQDTTDLARLVAALLRASPTGLPVVKAVQESGPNEVPDQSGQPLRLLLFTLRTRGEVIA